jgi:hypothetical protein
MVADETSFEDQTDTQTYSTVAAEHQHHIHRRLNESKLHITLKQITLYELIRNGFQVIVEPDFPPGPLIAWRGYRPDLLGVHKTHTGRHYVVVECETHPDKTRFAKKNWHEIALQNRLFEKSDIKFILAVPVGKISKVTQFRDIWEIWQIDINSKTVWKIPCINTAVKTKQHEEKITIKNQVKKMNKE